jgi:hypothetical protein
MDRTAQSANAPVAYGAVCTSASPGHPARRAGGLCCRAGIAHLAVQGYLLLIAVEGLSRRAGGLCCRAGIAHLDKRVPMPRISPAGPIYAEDFSFVEDLGDRGRPDPPQKPNPPR